MHPREQARAQTEAAILRIGREHLAAGGVATLSVRAVARDLGVASSAIYRYLSSREDLLAILAADAFDELGDAVENAIHSASVDGHRAQFIQVGSAIRSWALRNPARYSLIFGTALTRPPTMSDRTLRPRARLILGLVRVLSAAQRAGHLLEQCPLASRPSLVVDLDQLRRMNASPPGEDALVTGVHAFVAIQGAVSSEVLGPSLDGLVADRSRFFDDYLAVLADRLFAEASAPASAARPECPRATFTVVGKERGSAALLAP